LDRAIELKGKKMGTDIHGVFQRKTDKGWEDVTSNYGEERHSALFAWLGDVRNGFGFAGVPTHDRIAPLSSNRGYPKGFAVDDEDNHPIASNANRGSKAKFYTEEDSDPTADDHLKMWMGDHSHSWLSDKEILAAKPPRILRTGVVGVDFVHAWDGTSRPDGWCRDVSGPGIVMAASPSEISEATTHVRIEWFDDTAESFAYFIEEVRRLNAEYGEVRFVFGFDS
jgi:hypothetical protein